MDGSYDYDEELANEGILPTQITQSRDITGEEKFAIALITNCIENFRLSRKPDIKAAELEWINHDNGVIATFGYACEVLGVERNFLRRRVLSILETGEALPRIQKIRLRGQGSKYRYSTRPIRKIVRS